MSIPVVTGISPKEAKPGTKLTIRGENFGLNLDDLAGVYVCGRNCLYTTEWLSSSKITCRVGLDCAGRGDIIIKTKSGGQGTCNVQFTALKPSGIGPLEQSSVWVDEPRTSFIRSEPGRAQRVIHQDPLGIKGRQTVDRPTLAEHRALFPGQSPDPSHERFSPTWFLLHHHKNTSFKDLQKGLANMKNTSSTSPSATKTNVNTNTGSMQHIKDSLPVFFEVHEALNSIHGQMGKQASDRDERGITYRLEKLLEKAEHDARNLFKDVLTHKARADKIRNALAVIQRFKLLFYLPGRVNDTTKLATSEKGENFSQLMADIDKVRSLFADTKIDVFKHVMSELERLIALLQDSLHQQLLQPNITIKRQQEILRKLTELRASGDPTWDALQASFKTLRKRNVTLLAECQNRVRSAQNDDATVSDQREIVVDFAEQLVAHFKCVLPDIWRLWVLYSTGTMIHNDSAQSNRIKQAAFSHTKEVKRLFSDEILFTMNMARGALLPETLKPSNAVEANERQESGIWPKELTHHFSTSTLSRVLRLSRELEKISTTQQSDKIHGVDNISEFSFDLRVKTVRAQMNELGEELRAMYFHEDWELQMDGGTKLPNLLIGTINEFSLLSKEIIKPLPFEQNKNLFDRIQVETELRSVLAEALSQFPKTLASLAKNEQAEAEATHKPITGPWPDAAVRLVTVLSNSIFCRTVQMNKIEKMLSDVAIPEVGKICTQVQKKFIELDSRLIEDYLETRRDPIVCSIEPGMYSGFFDWSECNRPIGVRPYVKLCLVEVVAVHAELHSVSQKLLVSVLPKVIDGLAEEFVRLFKAVSKFSRNGAVQAHVELGALRECTALYVSPRSEQLFDEAAKLLPPVTGSEDRHTLDEILDKFRHDMMTQLTALRDSN